MRRYVGLDVSQRETSVCVVNWSTRLVKRFLKVGPSLIPGICPSCFASMRHWRSGSALRRARWQAGLGTSFVGLTSPRIRTG